MDSTFYTDERIDDAVTHILPQAWQRFSETARSSTPPDEFDHFKCPFYASNPERYRDCLALDDLRSDESVIKHIERHHMRSHYCPRCSETFEAVQNCDAHILKKKCITAPLKIPDGINFHQKGQLKKTTKSKDYTDLRPEKRWQHIYGLVFPGSQSYRSATMDTEVEKRVLEARVFWETQGWEFVNEYCPTKSILEIEVKKKVYEACLKALVKPIIDEISIIDELGWIILEESDTGTCS